MTQLSSKGRERRRKRYQAMLLEARLLGLSQGKLSTWTRSFPDSHNLRDLAVLINALRNNP